MNASTDQQTNPDSRIPEAEHPVSSYSLSFGREILTDEEREFLMERTKPRHEKKLPEVVAKPKRLVMNRRNLGLLAAILAVAVVHFSLQLNFSRHERSSLRVPAPVVETPSIPDSVSPAAVNVAEPEFQAETISAPTIAAPAASRKWKSIKQSVPKAEVPETRAERLRRAEKILTGI